MWMGAVAVPVMLHGERSPAFHKALKAPLLQLSQEGR